MAQTYDAIIIGTGQAGPPLAGRLTGTGMNVAVVERHLFGGTCVNTGCIPTKTLVASARTAYMARRSADFGVTIGGAVTVDMKKVKARKDELVHASNSGVENWLKKMERCTVFEGHARFEGPRSVRVGDDVIESDRIFINVGARASIPPIPGIESVDYMTNSRMMAVDFLPEYLLVLGGSYIGLEFGQMYRRFGSEVTVIQRDEHLVSREDEDVSLAVKEIVEAEGVTVCTDTGDFAIEKRGERIAIRMMCGGAPKEVEGSHLLVATGRKPNTDDLGLEKAGVAVDERGYVQVDDELKTNVPGIWAMGDCNGKGAFTHTSYNDFEIVAANLLDGDPRRLSDRIMTYALYIDPPLARAGMSERQVRESGRKALVAKKPMAHIGRAKEKSETRGFMKFLVDAETKKFLGATILGVGGDEIIHCVLDVMYAQAPYTTISRAMHIHPTVAELIPTTLQELKPLE